MRGIRKHESSRLTYGTKRPERSARANVGLARTAVFPLLKPELRERVDFNSGKGSGVFEELGGISGADMFKSFEEACLDLAEYISEFAF
jgi:hypothetical protein